MNTQQPELAQPLSSGSEYDILLNILFGAVGVVIGWLFINRIKKPQTKKEAEFYLCISMCVSGTMIIFKEIVEFFIDFYTGSNLLHADFVEDNHWLYRVFGFGMSPEWQRPLLDTDEDMGIALISAILSVSLLFFYIRLKHKALFVKTEKSEIKTTFKEKLARKIRVEKERLRNDCNIADLLLWWCTRALMIYAFFVMEVRAEANLLLANIVATFAVTLIHLVFPTDSFFAKISYRVQSLVTIVVFLGSYCGNYVFIYNILPRYDLFIHFISGTLVVLGGYYISLTLIRADSKKNAFLVAFFAVCFSCFVMPAWEISEFIGDFIWGTSNQGFYWGPTDDSFLFVIFGRGAYNTKLYPLYDTFYDVLLAVSTTIPTGIVLYLSLLKKLRFKNTVKEVELEKQPALAGSHS